MNLVTIDELSYSPTDALDMEISGDCKTLREELVARAAVRARASPLKGL